MAKKQAAVQKDSKSEPRKSMNDEAVRPPADTVGGMLRAAREKRGLTLEDVSGEINVRVSQLRAIEEGRVEDLPGITYALGFVRSYAAHIKLNSADIVQKFKIEHGMGMQPSQSLHMPEALRESPKPDMMMIGVAVFCAALVLLFWAVFSGGDEGDLAGAGAIPDISVLSMDSTPDFPSPETAETAEFSAVPEAADLLTSTETDAAALFETPVSEDVTLAEAPSAPVVETETAPAPASAPEDVMRVQAVKKAETRPEEGAQGTQVNVINVKRGKSRITLDAKESSWIEIVSDEGETIFKKVLRPGDRYFVPDQPGLSLKTSNAGGMTVTVDGEKVQPFGLSGEIVRGIDLDPKKLKTVRVQRRRR